MFDFVIITIFHHKFSIVIIIKICENIRTNSIKFRFGQSVPRTFTVCDRSQFNYFLKFSVFLRRFIYADECTSQKIQWYQYPLLRALPVEVLFE